MYIKTINDGKIYNISVKVSKYETDISNLYIRRINNSYTLIIDSIFNYIDIVPNDFINIDRKTTFIKNRYSVTSSKDGIKEIKKIYKESIRNNINKNEIYSFAICFTYACNMNCIYCFERNNTKKFKSISMEKLENMLDILDKEILSIRNDKSSSPIYMELFGGEPLLKKNRNLLERVLDFCREKNIYVSITTNGMNIISLIDCLVCYRDVIACFCITLDGTREVHNSRRVISEKEGSFDLITKGIQILLDVNFEVVCSTNIDRNNINNMSKLFEYYSEKKWFDYENFSVQIGRVDDKFNSGNTDIVSETEILCKLNDIFNYNKPKWLSLAFLKSIEKPANRLDVGYGQEEYGKAIFHHCWATSPIVRGSYIGPDLELYRCTVSVCNKNYITGNLSENNSLDINNEWMNHNLFLKEKCIHCEIGGYCAGGCKIEKDNYGYEYICNYNKRNFDEFIEKIAIKKIESLVN